MRGRKKSEATREAILRCASEVFSARPFHEVLIDDISARLQIGKGTVYRYFDSKEALYFATIIAGLQGMHEAMEEVLRRDQPLEATIAELTRTLIGYFWERRDFFVLLHRHEPKLDPGERAEWQRRREEYVAAVTAVVRQELARRRLRGIDPRLAVEMLFGMIRAVCLFRAETDAAEDLARQVTHIFLTGLLSPAAAAVPRRAPAMRTAR
jgi:AcrR family transcriptional regulator